jgi:hypothetical protein
MKPTTHLDLDISKILWGIPHSATIGELLKAVFSLWSVPTTIGKLFKPIGD